MNGATNGAANQVPPPPEVKNGWFTETEAMWAGQKFSLALEGFSNKSILFQQQTGFQSILVFRSAQYGNVMVLDGVIQLTERDEFSYHEHMVHIPMMAHPKPERILIVGGGDGGALREVCRHSCVKSITVIEIDPVVVQAAKDYFSNTTSQSFLDERVQVLYADAAKGIREFSEAFDVILCDTSDPVGPAESLFKPEFYEDLYKALRPGGVICTQAESFWINIDLVSDLLACCQDIFDSAEYCSTMVPTYPCGQIGFICATKSDNKRPLTCRMPLRKLEIDNLKWYSSAMHQAAFVLPPFVSEKLGTTALSNSILLAASFTTGQDEDDGEDTTRCFLDKASCSIM